MSVLSFPRIYFQGFMSWDPCTFNNNDALNTYSAAEAALNWSFLATQGPTGITPENFQETFRPWAITPQSDIGSEVPCEWNMFGSHAVEFVQFGDTTSEITGGALGPTSVVTSDPLIGQQLSIGGGPSGPAVLVDTNPASFWSSQIYWGDLSFGSGATAISGPMNFRMHSRYMNTSRFARVISKQAKETQPASGFSCCWQTAIPFEQVSWPAPGLSPLADALREAASAPGAQGIMVRFTAYANLYFQNGILNAISPTPSNYADLAEDLAHAWELWNNSFDPNNPCDRDTSGFFSNPCYSHIVGVIGVWNEGELASVPGGRYLIGPVALEPVGPTGTSPAPSYEKTVQTFGHAVALSMPGLTAVPFGPVAAEVDLARRVISLDFSATIPEYGTSGSVPGTNLTKADYGPLSLRVLANGQQMPIATIPYPQYGREAYEASAGIIDVPFPASLSGPLGEGTLYVQAIGQTALLEQTFSAQTDTRGIYLDQGATASFDVSVWQNGVAAPGANVLIARYGPTPQIPAANPLALVPAGPTAASGATGPVVQVVDFTSGKQQNIPVGKITTNVTVVTADDSGVAEVDLAAQGPGFLVLSFYPYASDGAMPVPPPMLLPPNVTANAYYTTIRVLPFDDAVPQQFVDFVNGNPNATPEEIFAFIYNPPPRGLGILYLYDMLFNVMLEFVWLGNYQCVHNARVAIWNRIAPPASAEGTGVMPITRDLSAGKRLALQLWIYLDTNDYAVQNFSVNSIPAGWTPTTPT